MKANINTNDDKVKSQVGINLTITNKFLFVIFVLFAAVLFVLTGGFIWYPVLMLIAHIIHKRTGKKHVNLWIASFDF